MAPLEQPGPPEPATTATQEGLRVATVCPSVVVSSKATLRRPNVPPVTQSGQFFVPTTINRDLRGFPASAGVDEHC